MKNDFIFIWKKIQKVLVGVGNRNSLKDQISNALEQIGCPKQKMLPKLYFISFGCHKQSINNIMELESSYLY